MDDALRVNASKRPLQTHLEGVARPDTIAWHALRAWEEERVRHRLALREARETAHPAWIALADQVHALESLMERIAPALKEAGQETALNSLRLRVLSMEQMLEESGVDVVRPQMTEFTEKLAEYFEPISQPGFEEAYEPVLLEVISPAVVLHGALIREGKAVVGAAPHTDDA